MTPEPHWTAYLSALLTPTVALFGAYIAYQQWRLNHHKLKLDLFEKRWKIYSATHDAMAVFINGSEDDRREYFVEFQRRIMDARFLCSENTVKFLESVRDRIFRLMDAERKFSKLVNDAPERTSTMKQITDETDGLRSEHKSLVSIFSKELQITF
ncbi:hypothetical protein ACFQAT_28395 [Undibacterium arcticum]|uniref:Uncharacterized protein n=1 Tax=Undibacterium arcticum TaxID=1762892 RepID=A0ABV7F9Y2_9BURK